MGHRETEHNHYIDVTDSSIRQVDVTLTMPCRTMSESKEKNTDTKSSASVDAVEESLDESVGADRPAVVVGCNANNDNASARTVNGNHAVSNSNDNYAGRFSLPEKDYKELGKTCTARPARTNTTEEKVEQSYQELLALLQCEYSEDEDSAPESNAMLPFTGLDDPIWKELAVAQSKRHLKGLKKFLTNRTIIRAAVDRCLSKAAKSPQREEAVKNKEDIINKIYEQMTNETYEMGHITSRTIRRRNKTDKDRNADIYTIFDRCVQNLLLLIIGPKLRNKLTRNVYSGIEGRSTTSKDRRFCMIDRVHDFCCKHPDAFVMMTDIRHFYESLRSDIVLSIVFETVYDRYTRIILTKTLLALPTLPIGGTLSQALAMLVCNDCDRYIINHFKPTIYCIFGDNRLFGDNDKKKLAKIKEYQSIWYESRLRLTMKGDYCLRSVKSGFRFCKTDYIGRFTKIRAELRRRTIRGAIRGQQHYAGYKGFLLKTDSRRLQGLIENSLPLLRKKIKILKGGLTNEEIKNINNIKMSEDNKNNGQKKWVGEKSNLSAFIDHPIAITDFIRENSKKDTGNDHFYSFQILVPIMNEKGEREVKMFRSWNGSADILYFFERVEKGIIKLPVHTTVRKENNSFYFEGYMTTSRTVRKKQSRP